ncbi:hypothetical protein TNIN_9491 [Trichonephila inaurata madagascariensis]|uniref:Uncharacterized protein n=1 Tax=Trichonephila inaurata madagascariensis TaxID=2747483 RepID=A0A8X7CAF4_9ARAC|nr:hypothetical protein TNIN_9491 [Trichonephila inaurata madagascariensis]
MHYFLVCCHQLAWLPAKFSPPVLFARPVSPASRNVSTTFEMLEKRPQQYFGTVETAYLRTAGVHSAHGASRVCHTSNQRSHRGSTVNQWFKRRQ